MHFVFSSVFENVFWALHRNASILDSGMEFASVGKFDFSEMDFRTQKTVLDFLRKFGDCGISGLAWIPVWNTKIEEKLLFNFEHVFPCVRKMS